MLRERHGFTMLELLIAAAVMGILFAGIYNTFRAQQRAYVIQYRVSEMNQNSRVALEIMSRQIRNAAYNPRRLFTIGANVGIQVATASTIVFTQDIDADGHISSDGEWMGFRYDSDNKRIDTCTGGSGCSDWQPFVEQIHPLQFQYVLEDGTRTSSPADPDDIREVEIQLVSKRKQGLGAQMLQKTLASSVQIRNLALK